MTSVLRSLDGLPSEVLAEIAFFSGTTKLLGPPSTLLQLLCTNRVIYSTLCVASNPHLYARIFLYKFDSGHVLRRLDHASPTAGAFSTELIQRFVHLKRMRDRLDSINDLLQPAQHGTILRQVLWTAYLMMLEDEGRNEKHLREYARISDWLMEFWFHERGASMYKVYLSQERWPRDNEDTRLAMWLLCFLIAKDDVTLASSKLDEMKNLFKILALCAPIYPLCIPGWAEFSPICPLTSSGTTTRYAVVRTLRCPPLTIPAILSYLRLEPRFMNDLKHLAAQAPGAHRSSYLSKHFRESEWDKCITPANAPSPGIVTSAYTPGSVAGVWEGIYVYTDYLTYICLLSGAEPSVLQNGPIAHQTQIWRLREFHLLGEEGPALSEGDPLQSFIPDRTSLSEDPHGITVKEPEREENIRYRRITGLEGQTERQVEDNVNLGSRIRDIIIVGEGHSAWGGFHLRGRVRRCDGLVSLCKDYDSGTRGRWLYRGYLIGNRFVGRWRDAASPYWGQGYEGCFLMQRRS